MASKTTNYNLHKIDLEDSPPDISVLGPNFDFIDTKLKEFEDGKVDKVAGKGLSTNDFTTEEKNKLTNITSGAEVNQNAFSFVKVGTTTVAADTETDTLELVAGSNVVITPDAVNDKLTFAVTVPVASVNGKTGSVTLTAADVGAVSNQAFTEHLADDVKHITPEDRAAWNSKLDASSLVDATTSRKGITQLNNSVTSTSTTQAATAYAVKQAYDRAAGAYVTGTFTGDGTDGRFINLGFTPSAVLLLPKDSTIQLGTTVIYGGLALNGYPVQERGGSSVISIATGGFRVSYVSSNGNNQTNSTSGELNPYRYIAFR